MSRRASLVLAVVMTATFAACSNAPTSNLEHGATPAPTATAAPQTSPTPTPLATPVISPSPAMTGPTPTAGPISLAPSNVAAANVVPVPNSNRQATVCANPTPNNYTCFSGDPTEVDPTEAGFNGSYSANVSNSAIAVTTLCSASGAPQCTSPNGVLVYPQGVGQTTISVSDGNGNATNLPVAVSETTVNITLQGLPNAQQLCIGYSAPGNVSGNVVSFGSITSAGSNPTVSFVNVPVPVNVTFSSFQVVVNPANSGMSGCKNGTARATASNFSFAAGVVNTKNITVTATST